MQDKCRNRPDLQRPKPGDANCPRQNGVYPSPDPTECDKYYSCLEGKGALQQCVEGLHFEPSEGVCVWARESTREGCLTVGQRQKQKKKKRPNNQRRQPPPQDNNFKQGDALSNGFTCPGGKLGVHLALPHPTSCRLYYVCLNGVTPKEAGCKPGTVFNDVAAKCDDPANVPRCANQNKPKKRPRPNTSSTGSGNSNSKSGGLTSDNPDIKDINKFLELLQNPAIQGILKPELVEALSSGAASQPDTPRSRPAPVQEQEPAPPPVGTPAVHRRIPPQRNNRFTQKFLPRVKPVGKKSLLKQKKVSAHSNHLRMEKLHEFCH